MDAADARKLSMQPLDNERILQCAVTLEALRGNTRVKVKCFGPVDLAPWLKRGYDCTVSSGTTMHEQVVTLSWRK